MAEIGEGISLKNNKEVNGKMLKECTEKWKEAYKKLSGETQDFSGIFLIKNFMAQKSENQSKMDELKEILFKLELHSIVLEEEDEENRKRELEEIKLKLENM